MDPAASNWYERFETAETADGKTWEDGFVLHGDVSRVASVTYNYTGLGNVPSVIFLEFAPAAGQNTAQTGRLNVIGLTSGRTLYRSEPFGANANPFSVSVNIGGETAGIRLDLVRGFDVLFEDPMVQ